MKKILFSTMLFFQAIAFSQAIATSSGISVQGVLKDTSGAPLANLLQASLDFTIYYLDDNEDDGEVIITSITDGVNTNEFGVFSYVVNVDSTTFDSIAFYQTYMRISSGGSEIFDQKLYSVPYATHAKNGYPAGTILPYMGSNLPSGWLWCNGESIPNDVFYASLRDLIGSNTPNLSGVFLRGTGTHGSLVNYYEWGYDPQGRQTTHSGPALRSYQNDGMSRHAHARGDLALEEAGRHIHPFRADGHPTGNSNNDGHSAVGTSGADEGLVDFSENQWWKPIDYAGNHTHTILGNTGVTGNVNEVRPVNYGVNYIIKI